MKLIRSQFHEKRQEGENPGKGVVVTKGHMCIQGEAGGILGKEGGMIQLKQRGMGYSGKE